MKKKWLTVSISQALMAWWLVEAFQRIPNRRPTRCHPWGKEQTISHDRVVPSKAQTNNIDNLYHYCVRKPVQSRLYDKPSAREICERLDLKETFDRWRYLQKLLDSETQPDDVNSILFLVLDRYLRTSQDTTIAATENLGSPERTVERTKLLESVLEKTENGSIKAVSPPNFDSSILLDLEHLLPDPVDEADDHQSTWDFIRELHGREAVKVEEKNGRAEWRTNCLVARVLIFYDFLQKGLLAVDDEQVELD